MYHNQRSFPYIVRLLMTLLLCPSLVIAQTAACIVQDPGPRPAGSLAFYSVGDGHGNIIQNFAQQSQDGTHNSSGNVLPHVLIGSNAFNFWEAGLAKFGDLVSVQGTPATEPLPGLGPRLNGNSCFMCHSQPAIGGTSPGCVGATSASQTCTPLFLPGGNPQIALAHHRGASNIVPQIVASRPNGPVVEARFPRAIDVNNNPTNVLDGSVKALYTIKGRDDAPVPCDINQPPLDTELANNNLIMRIPTPTFGVGFVETTPDATLVANLNSATAASASAGLAVKGRFNTSGNDQSITRFGWKAQNPSLLIFSGEASNVELGVTNEMFPFERDPGDCEPNPTPEDFTTATNQTLPGASVVAQVSNAEAESFFMFLNTAPALCDFSSGVVGGNPQCLPLGTSAINGMSLFSTVHCDACHTPTLQTGPSTFSDLNNAPFHPFSDFALHHMGANLTDGVNQGQAGPDEFRTAPLWGAGQRLFFLHDGRTSDIVQAIQQHMTAGSQCTTIQSAAETFILNGTTVTIPSQTSNFCGSEANQAVAAFNALSSCNQLDLIHFLRSL